MALMLPFRMNAAMPFIESFSCDLNVFLSTILKPWALVGSWILAYFCSALKSFKAAIICVSTVNVI